MFQSPDGTRNCATFRSSRYHFYKPKTQRKHEKKGRKTFSYPGSKFAILRVVVEDLHDVHAGKTVEAGMGRLELEPTSGKEGLLDHNTEVRQRSGTEDELGVEKVQQLRHSVVP